MALRRAASSVCSRSTTTTVAIVAAASLAAAATVASSSAAASSSVTTAQTSALSVASAAPPKYITAVSANGRYLVDQNGDPILIRGDTGWAMMTRLSPSEMDTYLGAAAANGVNAIIASIVTATGTGGPADSGATYDGVLPFISGDITSFNSAYWSRMDSYVAKARDLGITLFLFAMDGWTVTPGTPFHDASGASSRAYCATLSARYPASSYPNVVWMFGGDYDGGGAPGTFADTQYDGCLAGIRSTGDVRPASIQLSFKRSNSFDAKNWEQRADMSFSYNYYATYDTVLQAYAKTWTSIGGKPATRPVFFGEGEYESSPVGGGGDALTIRKQAAWTLTSGGAGSFTGQEGVWNFLPGWRSKLDSASKSQLKAIQDTVAGLATWYLLVPDTRSRLVTSGRGSRFTWSSDGSYWNNTNSYVTAAVTPDRSLAVIYNPDTTGNSPVVDRSALGRSPRLRRVDPTTGASTPMTFTTRPTAGTNAGGDHDWLFVYQATPIGTTVSAAAHLAATAVLTAGAT